MNLLAFARSKRALHGVSAAMVLSLTVAVVAPSIGRADPEDSAFAQQYRKKHTLFSGITTSNANTAHSPSSGIPATTETAILNDGSVAPFITPNSAAAAQALAEKYAKIVADGGWPEVPRGRLKKGSKGKGVALLNQRLYIEGYLRVEATQGEYAQLFTSATEDALRRFQSYHGLAMTGMIDGSTLAALNVPAGDRLATIKANIPRLAEYSKNLGNRYVVVNVPAQQIETVSDGKVYSLHNAIVGRPLRPTPVVMTPLTIVRFNPYWNAPPSIVERDILPRMLSSGPSRIMAEMNMKVFDGVGGPEVDPDKINWRKVRVDDYHFRQEPGGSNAMATAKVEFNSPFGIYLHDTPEPQLFKTSNRFYSSGCVRVEKVAILLNWILQGQDGIDAAKIASLAETKERLDVNIANAPQLRVAYLTAWPTKDGIGAFRSDIYELDGTGFVVGQPLPVGEKLDGQRFVLKPIPRLQQDIDTDSGGGFASLFRRNRDDLLAPGALGNANGTLGGATKAANGKPLMVKRTASKGKGTSPLNTGWLGSNKDQVGGPVTTVDANTKPVTKPVKKVAVKKPVGKTTVAAKKDAAKSVKVAKADPKAADQKAKPVTAATPSKPAAPAAAAPVAAKPPAAATTVAAKPPAVNPPPSAAPAVAKAPAAKSADCKPASDGKLPPGCPVPAPSNKPAAAAGKTADAAPH